MRALTRLLLLAALLLAPLAASAQEISLENRFKALDKDGDKRISAEEWKGAPARFAKLDKNQDGFIEFDEFEAPPPGAAAGPQGKPQDGAHPPASAGPPEKPQEKARAAAKDETASCDKCQADWRDCLIGKVGSIKQRCDEAMFRCQSTCQ